MNWGEKNGPDRHHAVDRLLKKLHETLMAAESIELNATQETEVVHVFGKKPYHKPTGRFTTTLTAITGTLEDAPEGEA